MDPYDIQVFCLGSSQAQHQITYPVYVYSLHHKDHGSTALWDKNMILKHGSSWILRILALGLPKLIINSHIKSIYHKNHASTALQYWHYAKNMVLYHGSSRFLYSVIWNSTSNHISCSLVQLMSQKSWMHMDKPCDLMMCDLMVSLVWPNIKVKDQWELVVQKYVFIQYHKMLNMSFLCCKLWPWKMHVDR